MFGGPKVKLDKDLLTRCKRYAKEKGFSSVEEFVTYTLEKELRGSGERSAQDEEEVTKRLKGLGYIE